MDRRVYFIDELPPNMKNALKQMGTLMPSLGAWFIENWVREIVIKGCSITPEVKMEIAALLLSGKGDE